LISKKFRISYFGWNPINSGILMEKCPKNLTGFPKISYNLNLNFKNDPPEGVSK
jgi:hypothetical protein